MSPEGLVRRSDRRAMLARAGRGVSDAADVPACVADDLSEWNVEKQWQSALSWYRAPKRTNAAGRKHDAEPLVRMLRGAHPIPEEVRAYLADVIAGRPKDRGNPGGRSEAEDVRLLDDFIVQRALMRITKPSIAWKQCEQEAFKAVGGKKSTKALLLRDTKARSPVAVLKKLVKDQRAYVDDPLLLKALATRIDDERRRYVTRARQADTPRG